MIILFLCLHREEVFKEEIKNFVAICHKRIRHGRVQAHVLPMLKMGELEHIVIQILEGETISSWYFSNETLPTAKRINTLDSIRTHFLCELRKFF
jgi:hypothetical protein